MKDPINLLGQLFNLIIGLTLLVAFLFVGVLFLDANPDWVASLDSTSGEETSGVINKLEIVEGVHEPTGLLDGPGLDMVIRNCTGCHSAKLVTQNKATANGWRGTIQWMQETQGLWDLGENEEVIVNYLTTYYAPEEEGRRKNLQEPEWYVLD